MRKGCDGGKNTGEKKNGDGIREMLLEVSVMSSFSMPFFTKTV